MINNARETYCTTATTTTPFCYLMRRVLRWDVAVAWLSLPRPLVPPPGAVVALVLLLPPGASDEWGSSGAPEGLVVVVVVVEQVLVEAMAPPPPVVRDMTCTMVLRRWSSPSISFLWVGHASRGSEWWWWWWR